eukprot:gene31644-6840_t
MLDESRPGHWMAGKKSRGDGEETLQRRLDPGNPSEGEEDVLQRAVYDMAVAYQVGVLQKEVREEFEKNFSDKAATSTAHGLDRAFGPRLKAHMEYCIGHPDEICKVAAVQKKVNDVKGVMMDNIERVLERGEKIETMAPQFPKVPDSHLYRLTLFRIAGHPIPKGPGFTSATQFQKKGRQLRNKMWWQNCRMKIYVASALLLLGLVIFLIVCFTGGNNCNAHEVTQAEGLPKQPQSGSGRQSTATLEKKDQ